MAPKAKPKRRRPQPFRPERPKPLTRTQLGQLAAVREMELRIEAKAKALLDRRQEKRRCEESLVAFMRRAWREIETGELDLNWHHIEVAAALEAVSRGEIRNLVINIPPRCTKTLLVNVFWPAWIWAQDHEGANSILALMGPQVRFLCVSYGATLATEKAAASVAPHPVEALGNSPPPPRTRCCRAFGNVSVINPTRDIDTADRRRSPAVKSAGRELRPCRSAAMRRTTQLRELVSRDTLGIPIPHNSDSLRSKPLN